MGQAAKASLTARADREAATKLVWTLPVHAHYGGPYTDWLYTSPGIKSGLKKKKKKKIGTCILMLMSMPEGSAPLPLPILT